MEECSPTSPSSPNALFFAPRSWPSGGEGGEGGEGVQRGTYRVNYQMGTGLMAQLIAALETKA